MSQGERIEFPAELSARYIPVRRLGAGGIGMVYEARDRAMGRPVAVKFLLHPGDGKPLERFRREAEALGRVQHPGVLQVYDFGTLTSGPYLVMERVQGTSLQHMKPTPDLVDVARQLSLALDAIHAQGIIHRDVKPENVLIEAGGRAVLVDFGLMLDPEQSRLTATGGLVGSLAFTPPEVLGGADPSAATDWYALGVTLFQLAEDRLPYRFPVVLAAGRSKKLPDLEWRTLEPAAPLARLISGLLVADPETRIGSAAQVEAVLVKAGAPPRAGAPGEAVAAALQRAAVPLLFALSFLATLLALRGGP